MIIKLQLLSLVDLYRFKSEFYTSNESLLIFSETLFLDLFVVWMGYFKLLRCIELDEAPSAINDRHVDINDSALGLGLWSTRVALGLLAILDLVLLVGVCVTRLYLGLLTIDDLVLLRFVINDLVLGLCVLIVVASHHVIAFSCARAVQAL